MVISLDTHKIDARKDRAQSSTAIPVLAALSVRCLSALLLWPAPLMIPRHINATIVWQDARADPLIRFAVRLTRFAESGLAPAAS
eukprot:700689-Amphidinium_carterae.1